MLRWTWKLSPRGPLLFASENRLAPKKIDRVAGYLEG